MYYKQLWLVYGKTFQEKKRSHDCVKVKLCHTLVVTHQSNECISMHVSVSKVKFKKLLHYVGKKYLDEIVQLVTFATKLEQHYL